MNHEPQYYKRLAIIFAVLCGLSLLGSAVLSYVDLGTPYAKSASISLLLIAIITGFLCGSRLTDARNAEEEKEVAEYKAKVAVQIQAQQAAMDMNEEPGEEMDANHRVLAQQLEVGCELQRRKAEEERAMERAKEQRRRQAETQNIQTGDDTLITAGVALAAMSGDSECEPTLTSSQSGSTSAAVSHHSQPSGDIGGCGGGGGGGE